MRRLIYILLLAAAIAQGHESSKSWSDWASEAKALHNSGNYGAANKAYHEALTVAQRTNIEDRHLIELRHALAGCYAEMGHYAEAALQYRHALNLLAKVAGPHSLEYAVVIGEIAVLPAEEPPREETIALLSTAALHHRLDGSPQNLFSIRSSLVQLLLKKQCYPEAENVLLEMRNDLAKDAAQSPELLSAAFMESGVVRLNQQRYAEAADFYKESLRLQEVAKGSQHPALIRPMNALATAYTKMGDLDGARSIYQRAIQLCGKTLGEDHYVYGVLLQNYAFVLRKFGQKREAKLIDAQSRRIQQASIRLNRANETIDISSLQAANKER